MADKIIIIEEKAVEGKKGLKSIIIKPDAASAKAVTSISEISKVLSRPLPKSARNKNPLIKKLRKVFTERN